MKREDNAEDFNLEDFPEISQEGSNGEDNYDLLDSEEETPEQKRREYIRDLYAQGLQPAEGESIAGVSYEEFKEWEKTADPEVLKQRAIAEQMSAESEKIRAALEESAPELLQGRLPSELEELLSGQEYALGFNQTGNAETLTQANKVIEEKNGISLEGYDSYRSRFLLADSTTPDAARDAAVNGYRTYMGGKFVVAFPFPKKPEGLTPVQAAQDPGMKYEVPEDFLHLDEEGNEIVSAKYCAGFIDQMGAFYPNPGFMGSGRFREVEQDLL